MSGWLPYLNTRASDFIRLDDGTGYGGFGNYVPSPVLKAEPEAVHKSRTLLPKVHNLSPDVQKLVPRAIFVDGCPIHIMEFSHLRARLGDDFKYALNGTRSIPYTYGLSAPIGTPIPSLGELEARSDDFKQEIARLVEAINERRDVAKEAKSFTFNGGNYGGSLWDRTAVAISEGRIPRRPVFVEIEKLKPGIAEMVPEGIFDDGPVFGSKKNFIRQAAPLAETSPPRTGKAILEVASRPQSSPSWGHSMISGGTLLKLSVASIALFGAGWIAYEHVRRTANRDQRRNDRPAAPAAR